MSAHAPAQGAPTLTLEPRSAPVEVPSSAGVPWGVVFALVVIAVLVALVFAVRKRGWSVGAIALPKWRTATDAEQCERAFAHMARRLGVEGAEAKLIRRMAQEIEAAPVALLICPATLDRGAFALKRTWAQAEQYPEREIAVLTGIEQRLGASRG